MRNIRVRLALGKHFGGQWSLFEEAHGDVRGGKHRTRFQEQIPCKIQVIIKNALPIPGDFKPILRNESIVSLWRK